VCSNNLDSYAGENIRSWYGLPCWTDQRVGARQNSVPGSPGLGWGVELQTLSHKNLVLLNQGGGQAPHMVLASVKKKRKKKMMMMMMMIKIEHL
jgi:hypothetical protein